MQNHLERRNMIKQEVRFEWNFIFVSIQRT